MSFQQSINQMLSTAAHASIFKRGVDAVEKTPTTIANMQDQISNIKADMPHYAKVLESHFNIRADEISNEAAASMLNRMNELAVQKDTIAKRKSILLDQYGQNLEV